MQAKTTNNEVMTAKPYTSMIPPNESIDINIKVFA